MATYSAKQLKEAVLNEVKSMGGWVDEERAFAMLIAQSYSGIDEDAAYEATDIDGADDHGLDAIIHRGATLVIIQSKFSRGNKNRINRSVVDKTFAGAEWLFHGNPEDCSVTNPALSKEAFAVQEDFAAGRINTVELVFGSNSDPVSTAEAPVDAINKREKTIAGLSTSAQLIAGTDFLELWRDWSGGPTKEPETETLQLTAEPLIIKQPGTKLPQAIVTSFSGSQLAELYNRFGSGLFEANVRFYQGQNSVNTAVLNTIKQNDLARKKFWYLNNGLTIVCDSYSYNGKTNKLTIDGMQIVNGCQTTVTLSRARSEGITKGQLDKVKVLVRLIESKDEALLAQITEATNTQSAVKQMDLRSNDEVQRKLSDAFGKLKPPWFLEVKRGEWTARIEDNKAHMEKIYGSGKTLSGYGLKFRHLKNEQVAQAYLAFSGDPRNARSNKKNLFIKADDGGLYERVFTAHTSPYPYLLPALVSLFFDRRIKTLLKEIRAEQKKRAKKKKGKKPVTLGVEAANSEYFFWLPYSLQFFVATSKLQLEIIMDKADLKKRDYETLVDNPERDELFNSLFDWALPQLHSVFTVQRQVAEETDETFDTSNWLKGSSSWEKAQKTLLPNLKGSLPSDIAQYLPGK